MPHKRFWFIALLLSLLMIAASFIIFFDIAIGNYIKTIESPLQSFARPFNSFIDERIVLISSVLLFLIFRFVFSYFSIHMLFLHMLVTQCIGQLSLRIIKVVVGRARPFVAIESGYNFLRSMNFSTDFHSFPSGHALGIFIIASSLSYRFPKYTLLFFPIAFVLALSRVALLEHFISDILTSLVLALLLSKLVYFFSYEIVDRRTLNT